jgi:hypothetical protein
MLRSFAYPTYLAYFLFWFLLDLNHRWRRNSTSIYIIANFSTLVQCNFIEIYPVLNQFWFSNDQSNELTKPSLFRSAVASEVNHFEFIIDQSIEFTILSPFRSPTNVAVAPTVTVADAGGAVVPSAYTAVIVYVVVALRLITMLPAQVLVSHVAAGAAPFNLTLCLVAAFQE